MVHFNQFNNLDKKLIFILLFAFLSSYQVNAQVQKSKKTGFGIGYLEYLPDNYSSGNNYPVIVYLHGVGERGNDLTDLRKSGLPKRIESRGNMCFTSNGKNECFIVISPQLPSSYSNWDTGIIDKMIDYVVKNYKADPDRINLTGFSLGGGGTWAYSYSSENRPNKLASMAPVAGWANDGQVCYIAESNLSVWAFHGADDTRISPEKTKSAINALKNCNPSPNPSPKMTIYSNLGHSLEYAYTFDHSKQNPNLFEWFLAQRRDKVTSDPAPSPDNKAPVANAGSDATTKVNYYTLNGTKSTDSDGKIVKYSWKKVSGSIDFGGTHEGSTYKVSNLREGDYVFELTVTDDDGATSKDKVAIKYAKDGSDSGSDPDPGTGNSAPVANAGSDVTIYNNYFTLDGTKSSDSDGKIVRYTWLKTSGSINFGGMQEGSTYKVTNLRPGDYVFELTVTDDDGAKSTDKIAVKYVKDSDGSDAPTPDEPDSGEPLVAKAGNDVTINVANFKLDGTGSYANGGKIVKYEWEKISGSINFGGIQEGATYWVNDLRQGDYVFELTVTDNDGNKAQDRIKVTYNKTDDTPDTQNNTAPVAKAGNDITIYTPNRSVTLDGTQSYDSDGKIVKYEWEKISGSINFGGIQEGATYKVNDMRAGDYEFELVVVDDDGARSSDRIKVHVINSSNSRTITENLLNKGKSETQDGEEPSKALKLSDISVYPNPFQSNLTLDLGAAVEGKVDLALMDLAGKTIYQSSSDLSFGEESINLDLSKLNIKSGIWFLKITREDGESKVVKLMKN